MCKPNSEIQFCSCADENELKTKNIYVWNLSKYLGSKETDRKGKIMMPTSDLGNGISAQNIIDMLNSANIFDFEYLPSERDTLHISFNSKSYNDYVYFTLIFKNGVWQKGSNPAFSSLQEEIAKGKLIVFTK